MATKAGKENTPVKTKKAASTSEKKRLWLMYPPQKITRPILWELGKRFDVITNIRQASVNDEIGIVCLELDGKAEEIKSAITWLVRNGIKVEPVEINVIES